MFQECGAVNDCNEVRRRHIVHRRYTWIVHSNRDRNAHVDRYERNADGKRRRRETQ